MNSKYCVVGAGPSGLTVVKNFRQRAIPCDCFEREDDVGGNWYFGRPSSSVYESTYLISSKQLTQYTDFPMPDEFPAYPSHRQALDYLRSYADTFGLRESITLNTAVERILPTDDGQWQVVTKSQSDRPGQPAVSRVYRGVVIANGHHWDAQLPHMQGSFSGEIMHSRQYKTAGVLKDRRVLVVGAGNSGCDVAVESAQHAAKTFLSVRRGYHFMPKFVYGMPVDQFGERLQRWGLPLWLRRLLAARLIKLSVGRPDVYGLPQPDHKLLETHPIVNSQLLYYVGHGAIHVKPPIERLCGDAVRFADGSEEPVDLIVCATGYKISFPFIDDRHLNWRAGRPHLYLNVFHPTDDRLFVAGLIQPNSGQWGLTDYQAQLIASFIVAMNRDARTADWFRRLKRTQVDSDLGGGIRYLSTPRHLLEVEYYSYRKRLRRLLAKFGANARLPLEDDRRSPVDGRVAATA